ncbi:MAG: 3-hydroxyacyl-ACP dehydratase FabZ [Desulfobacterales bacterium]|jgi:beta-hydroxyacyl-ACP dehydratase FabZ|nr:3-hydroxyacyl-[acyl-carrier-protein] dehydratase FabZ [Desulfobacter sp.]MDP6395837.1 3-hydroxyacyl-ACP dehydratase FabZ [Desulfobacterales bacterium]MDP6681429.1 3-hydroxyacyl-ACP dehydratase FabZ [Desulfobacterales bacterium]MDP6806571.1 3-hydroxyacyl-ACP dehydratase FabZ [Desulfobacterales bacterium]|tara:strand:- start:30901 stop:31347 length:447 start_codon:yes stop_codon:yes gene_type:complete
MKKVYDIVEIMKLLPHRYPFLLIDKIIELEPGKKVVALKNVSINEPFFQGHFPKMPIMPGVLIIEGMGQAGGVLAFETMPVERRVDFIYFMGMDKVRFRKPVLPGDQLIFQLKIIKLRPKVVKMFGEAFVSEKRVAEAELMASIGENS